MKINSVGSALGLWLSFLAIGTWVQAPGSMVIYAQGAITLPQGNETDAATTWAGTEIAAAWALATARPYDPSNELIIATAGSADVPVEFAVFTAEGDALLQVEGSHLCWTPLGSVLLDTVTWSDPNHDPTFDSGDELCAWLEPRIIAGATSVAGQSAGFFVATSFTVGGTSSGPSGVHGLDGLTIVLPMLSFESAELALAELGRAERAIGGGDEGGGGGGLSCFNPDWIGLGGQQCCELKAAWDAELEDCAAQFWNNFWACLLPSAGAVLITAFGCVASRCRFIPPPFGLTCAKFCLAVVGGGGLVLAAITCYNHARSLERECVRDANRYYQELFLENGCSLKPGASGAAMSEVLAAQKLAEGDTLDPIDPE